MNLQPQLEELEDRSAPSAADLAAFQQQLLPSLETQFHALVPIVQSNLQTNLNQLEALAPLFPASFQPLLSAVFAQGQQLVNAFPVLAAASFQQSVVNFELQLLNRQAVSPPPAAAPVAFLTPGFLFPFFPGGFFGFGGLGRFGFGGGGFSSGFSSGFSGFSGFSGGFSGGSGGSDPPGMTGRGMGVGLMSTVGALTLSSNP